MADLLLYVALAIVGYFIGAKMTGIRDRIKFVGALQTIAIIGLVLSMGARMGSNEEVVKNLNSIGLSALVMTVCILTFCLIAVSLTRRVMGIDHFGDIKGKIGQIEVDEVDTAEAEENSAGSSMTLIIVVTVVIGMIMGYFLVNRGAMEYELLDGIAGWVIKIGLCILLFLVGLDLGLEGTFVTDVKAAGLRIFAIPLAVIVGTLAGAALCSLVLPLTLRQALAVGAGFGWYSLAPVMIMEKGYITVSAISFMHNVLRELTALLLIPALAKKIGYIEAVGLPGSGASDVCLPLIVKSTKSSIAIYSFVTGITVSIMVPILVPLFLG